MEKTENVQPPERPEEPQEESQAARSPSEETAETAATPAEEDMESPEAAARREAAELKDQLLRMAADFDNFRKRMRKERSELERYGGERAFRDLLGAIDNLERALAYAKDDSSPIVQGVQMVHKQLLDTLASHGVHPFTSEGQAFDPERHEAMTQAPSATVPPGIVLQEIERGYTLHERLLRPAKVVVASRPAMESDGSEAGGGEPDAAGDA
jgi:molecular chaperone GrpE